MPTETLADLILALTVASFFGTVLGGMLYGMARDIVHYIANRPAKPSPQQLLVMAKALRLRATALEVKAEKARSPAAT